MQPESQLSWFWPLYNKEIAAGLCYDINLERFHYFNTDSVKSAIIETGKSREQIDFICDNCSNFPLDKE